MIAQNQTSDGMNHKQPALPSHSTTPLYPDLKGPSTRPYSSVYNTQHVAQGNNYSHSYQYSQSQADAPLMDMGAYYSAAPSTDSYCTPPPTSSGATNHVASVQQDIFMSAQRTISRNDSAPESVHIRRTKAGIIYAGHTAYLSNFYPQDFCYTTNDGRFFTFLSLEQAYQFLKADFAEDKRTADAILKLDRSSDIKKEGRNVKHQDKPAWDAYKVKLMLQLLRIKFAPGTQNAAKLADTFPTPLWESSVNYLWGAGVGFRFGAHTAFDTGEEIPGANIHGRLLETVRLENKLATSD